MIKDIVRDDFFLSQVSTDCTKEDAYIIDDLKDTLNHHQAGCVGMAGNMIGYLKNTLFSRKMLLKFSNTDLCQL